MGKGLHNYYLSPQGIKTTSGAISEGVKCRSLLQSAPLCVEHSCMHLTTALTDDSFIFLFFFSLKENCSISFLPVIFTGPSTSTGSYSIWCCTNLYLGQWEGKARERSGCSYMPSCGTSASITVRHWGQTEREYKTKIKLTFSSFIG